MPTTPATRNWLTVAVVIGTVVTSAFAIPYVSSASTSTVQPCPSVPASVSPSIIVDRLPDTSRTAGPGEPSADPTIEPSTEPTTEPSTEPTAQPCPDPTGSPTATGGPGSPTPSQTAVPTPSPTSGCSWELDLDGLGGTSPDSGIPPSDNGSSLVQDQLHEVADRILNLADEAGYPGFAGVVADRPHATLRLYWLPGQPLPTEIESIVEDPGQPITVVRESAPFSRNQLRPLSRMLLEDVSLDTRFCGFLHTVIVPEEGTGLIAEIEPYLGADQAALATEATTALTEAAGVPVTVRIKAEPVKAGRQDDASPWKAGARITAALGRGRIGLCSTAFGVDIGTKQYMLSAAHCFPKGALVFNGGAGPQRRQLGPVADTKPLHDAETIEVDKADTNTFLGGVNSNVSLPIRQPKKNVKGLFVCSSGASTGENCKLEIVATDIKYVETIVIVEGFGRRRRVRVVERVTGEGFVRAVSTERRKPGGEFRVAVGSGDSGGPVFFPRADTTKDHEAAGVISAGGFPQPRRTPFPCEPGALTTVCYPEIIYADISIVLKAFNATLR